MARVDEMLAGLPPGEREEDERGDREGATRAPPNRGEEINIDENVTPFISKSRSKPELVPVLRCARRPNCEMISLLLYQ